LISFIYSEVINVSPQAVFFINIISNVANPKQQSLLTKNKEVLKKHRSTSSCQLSWLNVSSQLPVFIDEASQEGI